MADGFGRQELVGKRFILAEHAEHEMLGFNARAAELASFIAGEKDHSPGLFGVALEHIRTLLQNDRVRAQRLRNSFPVRATCGVGTGSLTLYCIV